MICRKCGHTFSDEFIFCPECGQKIFNDGIIHGKSSNDFSKAENLCSGSNNKSITLSKTLNNELSNGNQIKIEKNLKQQPKNDETASKNKEVFAAVLNNDLEVLNELIAREYDINCTDIKGHTPLMIAAFKGYIEIAMRLLESNAEINAISSDGFTALKLAEMSQNKAIYKVINRKISDPFFTVYNPEYLEMVGTPNQNSNSIVIASKLEDDPVSKTSPQSDNINPPNNTTITIEKTSENVTQLNISVIILFCLIIIKIIISSYPDFFNELLTPIISSYSNFLKKSLTPEELIEEKNKELIEITKKGKFDSIKSIVSAGANINYISDDGTPLIIAAKYGKTKTLNTLLNLGANPDLKDKQERTPLDEAYAGRKIDCIISLIRNGATFIPGDKNYKMIFEYSLKNCNADLIKLCIGNNKNIKTEVYNYYINEIKSYQGADNVSTSAHYAKFMKSIGIFENLEGLDKLIENADQIANINKAILNIRADINTVNNNIDEIDEACYYSIKYIRAFVVASLDTGVFEIAFSPNSTHAILKTVYTDFQTKGWFEMQVISAGTYKGFNVYREATIAEINAIARKNSLANQANELIRNKNNEEIAKWKELEELKRKLNDDIAMLKEQPLESISTQEVQVNTSVKDHEQDTISVSHSEHNPGIDTLMEHGK
jgi:ankyrin repeat protein